MSDLEKFNVDSDLQSIADAMTVAGLNFCGGVFDHLETGEEFELTIAKKSGVRSMAGEIAELRSMLKVVVDDVDCYGELTVYNFKKAKDMLAKHK